MLKLAIVAGITLSAILCGMMTLRSSGLFQNNRNGELANDIKEIFGLPPIGTSNSQLSYTSGDTSSFSFSGGGGYLPPKSISDDENATDSSTTATFRIFILSTATTPSNNESSVTTTTTDSSATSTSITSTASFSPKKPETTLIPTSASPNETKFKEESLAEGTTVASIASTSPSPSASPTPYEYPKDPSPGFKIDLIWSTLVPPSASSLSNSENEVQMKEYSKLSDNAAAGSGAATLPNNGLYLPPNKEYLPPNL